MRMRTKKSALIAAVMAASLLSAAAVQADGARHYQQRQDYSHYRDYGHQGHDRDRHQKRQYGYRDVDRYHAPRYSRHVTNYYQYEDDDDDDKLLIGLAIGGLIGYAINSAGTGY